MKVGATVVCKRGISEKAGGPRTGEKFVIKSMNNSHLGFPLQRLDHNYNERVKEGTYPNWGISEFEVISIMSRRLVEWSLP